MPGKTKILVVEDDPNMCEMMQEIFHQDSYNLLPVRDGASAMETILREMPQLILVDLMMPNVPGFEIVKAIRSDPRIKHIPIMVCTAKRRSADIQACFALGVNEFISKPFDVRRFRTKVKNLLGHPS